MESKMSNELFVCLPLSLTACLAYGPPPAHPVCLHVSLFDSVVFERKRGYVCMAVPGRRVNCFRLAYNPLLVDI